MSIANTRIVAKGVLIGRLPELIAATNRRVTRSTADRGVAIVGEPSIDFPESPIGGVEFTDGQMAIRLTWQTEPTS